MTESARPFTTIELAIEPPLALLRLNRPESLNALSHNLMQEVLEALDSVLRDDQARVVILSGAGRCFSAGFDIALDEGWVHESPAATMDSLEGIYLHFIR